MSEIENQQNIAASIQGQEQVEAIDPEVLKVQGTLLGLEAWNSIEFDSDAAFVSTDQMRYWRLFDANKMAFTGNQQLRNVSHPESKFPAIVIRASEYRKSMNEITSLLSSSEPYLREGGKIFVIEDDLHDYQTDGDRRESILRRERILKSTRYDNPHVVLRNEFDITAWIGSKRAPQESLQVSQSNVQPNLIPDLEFEKVYEMAIPPEVKNSQLMAQRPKGLILYIDQRDPDTATVINPQTWQPLLKKGKPERITVSKIVGRRVAAVIYHTPPRTPTPEGAFEQELANAASLLNRTEDENEGIITSHHLGALFVVEDKGEDKIKRWREQSMNNIGLVMSIGDRQEAERLKVLETDKYLITSGRKEKKHSPVNLFESRGGRYFRSQIDRGTANLKRQGYEVDTTKLIEEARRSSVPPDTIGRIKDAGNVVITNRATGSRIEQTRRGTFKSRASTDDYSEPTLEDIRKATEAPKKYVPQPGDVRILDRTCGDCGEHLKERYFSKPGEYALLLIREVVCDSKAHRRGEKVVSNDFIRSLGKYNR